MIYLSVRIGDTRSRCDPFRTHAELGDDNTFLCVFTAVGPGHFRDGVRLHLRREAVPLRAAKRERVRAYRPGRRHHRHRACRSRRTARVELATEYGSPSDRRTKLLSIPAHDA